MNKVWSECSQEEYLYWQKQDRKVLRRINLLIKDIERTGYRGIGKPEPLEGDLSGYWSPRTDEANRLVYKIRDKEILIAQYRMHYGDKQKVLPEERFSYAVPVPEFRALKALNSGFNIEVALKLLPLINSEEYANLI